MRMAITENKFDHHGMTVHLIPGQKRKTVQFAVKFKAPLDRATITKRSLLTSVLEQGTEQYPSEKQLMQYLDELYGAGLSVEGQKKGSYHIITFRLEVANEKYLENEETMMKQAVQLLHDVIYEPYRKDGVFPEKAVTKEKRALKERIGSIKDEKLAYANMRLIDHMCEGERFGTHTQGYIEDLSEIDAAALSTYYETMLEEDEVDFYVAGDIDSDEVTALVKEIFTKSHHPEAQQIPKEEKQTNDVKEFIEVQEINQAKLHMGYRTNITYQDEKYFALHVFNGLFGGFPSSKLFMNVREKHSLAYYAASRIESHKGLLIVYSGIEASDYKKARDIIELQLQAIKDGDFTDAEVENIKKLLISDITETLDHLAGTIELFYQQVVGERVLSPQAFMEGIEKVTKQDVIEVAEQLTPDTVFLLTNRKEEAANE